MKLQTKTRTYFLGAVKITPAHSHADLEVAKRHNLPIVPVITEDGRIHESLKDSGFAVCTLFKF